MEREKGVIICESGTFEPAEEKKLEDAGYIVVKQQRNRRVVVIREYKGAA